MHHASKRKNPVWKVVNVIRAKRGGIGGMGVRCINGKIAGEGFRLIVNALRENEARTKAMIDEQPDLICRFRADGVITFTNRAFRRFFGLGENGAHAANFFRDFGGEGREHVENSLASLCTARPLVSVELNMDRPGGDRVWIQWLCRVNVSPGTGIEEFHLFGRDISSLKQHEERLRISLAEREVLLGEVHHRVKNNLQIISSILDMSGIASSDHRFTRLINDARSRIQAMALIHSQLMRSDRFDCIDMGVFVTELLEYMFRVHDGCRGRIATKVNVRDVYLDMDRAVPYALAMHEILSNTFRHAFPGDRTGCIRIAMRMSGHGIIIAHISDDGVGILGYRDDEKTESFGLGLVKIIILEQLSGTLKVSITRGTKYRIKFPGVTQGEMNVQDNGCG